MSSTAQRLSEDDTELLRQASEGYGRLRAEIGKAIVGQEAIVRLLLASIFSEGHALLVGVPGLAKTLLVRTLAEALGWHFKRIQFTPDMMPADIVGMELLQEDPGTGRRDWRFMKGPVFANIVLADEINRTPPKTQAALLEAMQEHQVTAAGVRHALSEPFFVLATQNPIEMEGTYPLPEAQLDRFMLNAVIDYLPEDEEVQVVSQTTTQQKATLEPLFTGEDVLRFQEVVRKVPTAEDIVRYAVRLAAASRPRRDDAPEFINEWVNWGAGLRAAQFMVLGAKARALLRGAAHVSPDDIAALAKPALRHRVLVNYRAEAEGVDVDHVIDRLLQNVPQHVSR